MKNNHFNVVIIGGGCAGASTALELIQQGVMNIAIVEKSDFSKPRVGETIQPPTADLLKQLNLWEPFLKAGHLPSSGVASAWGTSELAYTDFIFKTSGKGWHLDRNAFDSMVLQLAVERGATLFSETRLKKAIKTEKGWMLNCNDEILNAKFVVDASGRACAFAKQIGIQKVQFDDLHGIYTYWKPAKGITKAKTTHTLVETVENGWYYSAYLPDGTLAVALMTDTELIKTQQLKDNAKYLAQLQQTLHTKARLKDLEQLSEPSIKVASSYELETIVGDTWMAVGDSASAYDPLSSYGIHKALQNSIMAGEAIDAALCGDTNKLKDFEKSVQQAFEQFISTRYQYYAMETRWQQNSFWKNRQQLTTVHPLQELQVNTEHPPRWHKILPNEEIITLMQLCEQPITAAQLIQNYKAKSSKSYPDWRVIQAVSVLYNKQLIC